MYLQTSLSWLVLSWLVSVAPAADLQPTISVTGRGTASSPPDMATIITGVTTHAETAQAALEANNRAMQNLLDVLKENQIADKDVQTSNFDMSPEYQRDPRGQNNPKIIGYRATNQVRVQVRNLPQLGKVLDSLVFAGSNQVSGIGFGIDDPTGVLNQARQRTVADARSRAALYAQAAGVRLGHVISISEEPAMGPQPRFQARAMLAEANAVPVATGEQELSATIQMVYTIQAE